MLMLSTIKPVNMDWLAQFRSRIPADIDTLELGIAAAIIAAAFTLAYWIGLIAGKHIAVFLDDKRDEQLLRYDDILRASAKVIRPAITASILIAVRYFWNWQLYSELLIGGALALAVASAAYNLLRALRLGFWTSMAAAAALFVFLYSSTVGGITPVSNLLDQASFTLGKYRFSLLTLVSAILVTIFLIASVRLGNRAVRLILSRNKNLDGGQRLLGEKLAMVAFVIAAFFFGIELLGIDLTALAIFSGAFGLAIGFGLQKTFGNLIAGIILLWDRSIKPGDVIAVGDSFGSVNKIGIRAVSVITRDSKEHLIPNENLMINEVENWSYSSKNVRVKIPVGVSYATDMQLAEDIMLQAAKECPRVLSHPESTVWMTSFGDSSVNFEVQVWIKDPEDGVDNVRSDVLKRLWWLFKEHNIEIPFPQRDVHMRMVPDAPLSSAIPTSSKQASKPRPKK
jgi:potassium-dependent mechanosensitive channel